MELFIIENFTEICALLRLFQKLHGIDQLRRFISTPSPDAEEVQ